MGLWNPLNRAMMMAAGVGVLAACYAVAAWGQVVNEHPGNVRPANDHAGSGQVAGQEYLNAPTVTLTSLLVPASAWQHFDRAKSAAEHHNQPQFDRESAKALEIAPRFASMYLLRATVEMGARRYDAALASAESAALVDPGAMWTTVVLAGVYNGMHQYSDALAVLDRKHGYEAETWQAAYERARALTGTGNLAEALRWSGMAVAVAPPDFADAFLVRSNALMLAHRPAEAMAQMDLYLQFKGPQAHRQEVLAAREVVRGQIGDAQSHHAPNDSPNADQTALNAGDLSRGPLAGPGSLSAKSRGVVPSHPPAQSVASLQAELASR